MIDQERIVFFDKNNLNKKFIVYWMQASQRVNYNHALLFSILKANELKQPLIVIFCISNSYDTANYRHYYFMLEGIKELVKRLKERNIFFLIKKNIDPISEVLELSKQASFIVTDKGYTKIQKLWREKLLKKSPCSIYEIETDVIIPTKSLMNNEAYNARSLRLKANNVLNFFLKDDAFAFSKIGCDNYIDYQDQNVFLENIDKFLKNLKIDHSVDKSNGFFGGENKAHKLLLSFVENNLDNYHIDKNNPSKDACSKLSPYLHFGQISSLEIALKIKNSKRNPEAIASFLEEIIVRRELAINFVNYNENYDNIKCLPGWATKSLNEHNKDKREYLYSLEELENVKTHDKFWNASQSELIKTGFMHGYMRMYWGKKIIEWSNSYEKAYKTALFLNNKYQLDGRDPNSYAGIAWCFGKHDQAWKERNIFGKVRYMNENSLKKVDMTEYLKLYTKN